MADENTTPDPHDPEGGTTAPDKTPNQPTAEQLHAAEEAAFQEGILDEELRLGILTQEEYDVRKEALTGANAEIAKSAQATRDATEDPTRDSTEDTSGDDSQGTTASGETDTQHDDGDGTKTPDPPPDLTIVDLQQQLIQLQHQNAELMKAQKTRPSNVKIAQFFPTDEKIKDALAGFGVIGEEATEKLVELFGGGRKAAEAAEAELAKQGGYSDDDIQNIRMEAEQKAGQYALDAAHDDWESLYPVKTVKDESGNETLQYTEFHDWIMQKSPLLWERIMNPDASFKVKIAALSQFKDERAAATSGTARGKKPDAATQKAAEQRKKELEATATPEQYGGGAKMGSNLSTKEIFDKLVQEEELKLYGTSVTK